MHDRCNFVDVLLFRRETLSAVFMAACIYLVRWAVVLFSQYLLPPIVHNRRRCCQKRIAVFEYAPQSPAVPTGGLQLLIALIQLRVISMLKKSTTVFGRLRVPESTTLQPCADEVLVEQRNYTSRAVLDTLCV